MQKEPQQWLREWERLINALDFAGGRALFAEDVVSFGTFADMLHGLDELEHRQWRKIWPTIADFTFEEPTIIRFDDSPGTIGIVVLWHSKGRKKEGGWYPRKGRATLILKDGKDGLRCVHSHLSMEPGIPPLAD
ncbi:YybH family protein [Taklimakanibacter lacteus]|uniref:YybH family protein n=1 Tax=Taklimakanibacter lacteus TaxID=2268456 RepID=UPI0013C4E816